MDEMKPILGVRPMKRNLIAISALAISAMFANPSAWAGEEIVVDMYDDEFTPQEVVARHGDKIIFRNKSVRSPHAATLLGKGWRFGRKDFFKEQVITPGNVFIFPVPDSMAVGTYDLGCGLHEVMKAKVKIVAN
jgi:plastocyanin